MIDLADELGKALAQGNAILFVGADLREELGGASYVQRIAESLASRLPEPPAAASLPAVAQAYDTVWGSHALVSALREEIARFEQGNNPLHNLIADAVLPSTKLITTRFDNALERALEQRGKHFVRIVRDTDVPFFDETRPVLIKLQGDITQPDSLVITEEAIERFVRKLPTISSVVRAYFATKTLVFLGYDLDSPHFQRFFLEVTDSVGAYRRRAYAVAAQPLSQTRRKYWEDRNVEICEREVMPFLEALVQAVIAASRDAQPANPLQAIATPPLPALPYKGLVSFGADDAAIFSGRSAESSRLASAILANRLVVLHGEAGSGKSSLLQAGTGPLLAGQHALLAVLSLAPGEPPAEALVAALRQAGRTAGLPVVDQNGLRETISHWQGLLAGQIVLAIDGFEQVFERVDGPQRAALATLLQQLRCDAALDVRLVLAVREDYLGRMQTLDGYLPGLLDVRFRLERLQREAARAAIEEPARLFGLHWEEALVARLLDDLAGQADRGVLPPQLQVVCSRLAEQAAGTNSDHITQEQLDRLGGTGGILGAYLDAEVAVLAPEEQPQVWALLGALVSASRLRQRLRLDELARRADMDPHRAALLVDRLVARRLVQRYDGQDGRGHGVEVEVELSHDYLVATIADRLGDGFWARQRAWELVRAGLPEWEEHGRLLAADDVRLVADALGQARFSPAEAEMLYAAAIAWRQDAAVWEAKVPVDRRRDVLVGLLQHADPHVRESAALQVGPLADAKAAGVLAELAAADPDVKMRRAAAQALARSLDPAAGQPGAAGMQRLSAATSDPAGAQAALAALVVVRDAEPASQPLIPPPLCAAVRRGVWRARWQRGWHEILSRTLQGAQGGFWGLGLSLGLLLFPLFDLASGRLPSEITANLGYLLWLTLGMVPLVGLIGGAAGGVAAFGLAALSRLGDRPRPWRAWAVAAAAGAIVMGLGFVVLSLVSLGRPQPWNAMAAGCLIGLALVGAATAPLKQPRALRLAAAVAASMAAFAAVGPLGRVQFEPGDTIAETLSDRVGGRTRLEAQVVAHPAGEGQMPVASQAWPVLRTASGGASTWLQVQQAQLQFAFDPPLEGLDTCIMAVNRPLTVQVNGLTREIGRLGDITVAVESCSPGAKIVVTGPVAAFAVGGQDWAMDSLCPYFVDPIRDCMDFDGLHAHHALLSDQFPTWQWLLVGAICGIGFFLGLNRKR